MVVDEEGEFGCAVGEVEVLDGDVVVAGGAGEGPFGGAGGLVAAYGFSAARVFPGSYVDNFIAR